METEREELLCRRIADRDDGPADWDELARLAEHDPALWHRVLDGLRTDAALRAATAPLLAVAERVELPSVRAGRRLPLRSWVPWSLVAVLAVALALQLGGPRTPAAIVDDAAGTVLGELPRLLVEATPTADGNALRVVSLRRVIEANVVARVARLGVDEVGNPSPVPVDPLSLATPTDY